MKNGTGSGAPGAQVASLESASAERCVTPQRAHEAARTSPSREVTVHGEAVMQTIKRVWMGKIRKPHRLHFAIEREISLDVILTLPLWHQQWI